MNNCCVHTTNGLITENITNSTFHTLIGDIGSTIIMASGSTVQATNGVFTNLSGSVISPSQTLIKHLEVNNDSTSLIISDPATGVISNTGSGLHLGFNTLSEQCSIYAMTHGGVCGDLNLNLPFSVSPGTVNMGGLRVDSIKEFTNLQGVKIMDGLTFTNTTTLKNSDTININSENATPANSRINLQMNGTTRLSLSPVLLTSLGNAIFNLGLSIPAGLAVSIGGTQAVYNSNFMRILGGINDTTHVSTAVDNSGGWIALSAGYENIPTVVPRVVMGTLNNRAGLGGHNYNGSYISWSDLDINYGAGNVHIRGSTYESANELSVSGYIDSENGYKINNLLALFSDINNTIIYNRSGQLVLVDSSGNLKIDNSLAGLYIGNTLICDKSNVYLHNGSSTTTLASLDTNNNTFNLPNKSAGVYTLATTLDVSSKSIFWNNINTINVAGTYFTSGVICWDGVASGYLPVSISCVCENNSGGIVDFQFRLTNFDSSIIFFESPVNSFSSGSGFLRFFSSNIITPINGLTNTTPLIFQIKLISGLSLTCYSGSIVC